MRFKSLVISGLALALVAPDLASGARGGRGGGASRGGGGRGASAGRAAGGGGGFGGGMSARGGAGGGASRGGGGSRGPSLGPYGGGGRAGAAGGRPGAGRPGGGRPGAGGAAAGGAGRPGVGAGGGGRPGVGAGGAGRPGVGAGSVGGPDSGAGVRPGAGFGRPGMGAGGVGGPASGAGVRPGAGFGRAGVGAGGVGGPASGAGVLPGAGYGRAGAGWAGAGWAAGGAAVSGGAFYAHTGTYYASDEGLAQQALAINQSPANFPAYGAALLASHAGAWQPARLTAPSWYTKPGYGQLVAAFGLAATPQPADYGGNVVVQSDGVYVNGQYAASPAAYTDQAVQIAAAGQSAATAADEKWLPLGVFAIVEGDATTSDDIFQLAIDSHGVIRGNYHNLQSDEMVPISGSLDRQSQRAAWTIGSDQFPVYDAGIANLTKDATPVLVHLSDGQSHQMNLIRLAEP